MPRYVHRRGQGRIRRALALALALACAWAAGYARLGAPGPSTESQGSSGARQTRALEIGEYRFYAVQFGAFDSEADARALSESLSARGAAGYVLTDTLSRAIGAAYTSRADADKVCKNLSLQGVDACIYEVCAPGVELRVTAEEPLLDAIEAALPQSERAIAALGALALELDRGNLSAHQAQLSLEDASQDARAALGELKARLGGRSHALTDGLLSELNAVCAACDALSQYSVESAMDFSGKIKYNVIDLMQRHVAFMNLLIQPAASA